jgi:hypothetical protein
MVFFFRVFVNDDAFVTPWPPTLRNSGGGREREREREVWATAADILQEV